MQRTLFHGPYVPQPWLGYDIRTPKPGEIWALDSDDFRHLLERRHSDPAYATTGLQEYVWVTPENHCEQVCFEIVLRPGNDFVAYCRQLFTVYGTPTTYWKLNPIQYGLVFEIEVGDLLSMYSSLWLSTFALDSSIRIDRCDEDDADEGDDDE